MTKKLTPKQARFVEEYLVDLNATQAAIRAGYSEKTAKVIAAQNLSKLNIAEAIQDAIARRSERTQFTGDQLIQFWADIVQTPLSEFYDQTPDGGMTPKNLEDMSERAQRALQSVHVNFSSVSTEPDELSTGKISFVKLDVMRASENLAKALGIWIDRKEVGKPGAFHNYNEEQLDGYIDRTEARLSGGVTGKGTAEGKPSSNPIRRLH